MEKGEPKKGEKLTYEQLMQLAAQSNAENQRLRGELTRLNQQLQYYQMQDYYKRLEWLWTVIQSKDLLPADFVAKKTEEFIELLTPVEVEQPEKAE